MANQPMGFLDQLGLTNGRATIQAQRQQMINQAQTPWQRGAVAGSFLAPLVGGVAGAVKGAIQGPDRMAAAKQGLISGAAQVSDSQEAHALGQSTEEYRSNQRIRQALASQSFGTGDDVDRRIKMAEFVAREAQKDGNVAAQTQALQTLTQLRMQKAEFDKLSQDSQRAEDAHRDSTVHNVWLNGESDPRAAQDAKWDPTKYPGQKYSIPVGTPGVEYIDDNGKLQFKPAGQYHFKIAAGLAAEPFDKRVARVMSPTQDQALRSEVTGGVDLVRKSERLFSSISGMLDAGLADASLGKSGEVVTWFDNAARNLKGISQAFLGSGEKAKPNFKAVDAQGRPTDPNAMYNKWKQRAEDANDEIWKELTLPDAFKQTSAAAAHYRANVIDLAFVIANSREKANRGLSDNDIKLAIDTMAAYGSNPQAILRRMAEIVVDNASKIETDLGAWSGAFPDTRTPEDKAAGKLSQFENYMGGNALRAYRKQRDTFYKHYGITVDPTTNQIQFNKAWDTDIPGAKQPSAKPTEQKTYTDEENKAFLDQF